MFIIVNVPLKVTRESYATGYVELHRESGWPFHTQIEDFFPEHKVRANSYNVTMVVDENKGEIVSCQCLDCAASACRL